MNAPTIERQDMGKKRGRPPVERDEQSVRLGRRNATRAAIVAKAQGKAVSELLDDIVTKPLAAMYAKVLKDAEKDAGGKEAQG